MFWWSFSEIIQYLFSFSGNLVDNSFLLQSWWVGRTSCDVSGCSCIWFICMVIMATLKCKNVKVLIDFVKIDFQIDSCTCLSFKIPKILFCIVVLYKSKVENKVHTIFTWDFFVIFCSDAAINTRFNKNEIQKGWCWRYRSGEGG